MNKDKELSGQIKTQVEGIAKRVAKEVLGQAVLDLLNSDGHGFSKRPCTTCQTVSGLVGQPFGCVRKVTKQEPEFVANFLWPHEDLSAEEAGYEFVNAKTEAYRQQWWHVLVARIRADEAEAHR